MNNKKKCFIIMPISKTKSCNEDGWTGIFEHMIKPAVTGSRLGFECERAQPRTGAFIRDILEGLNRADVVIADLTDRNPNVCYELGIRHTLTNRTIIITQNMDDIPSDLRSYWVVTYEKDLSGAEKFKKKVREILREMQKNPEKPDSPVADFLQIKNIDILAYEKAANLKKISALISETSYNINQLDEILKQVKVAQRERKKQKERGPRTTPLRLTKECLELLVSTQYLALPQELSEDIRDVTSVVSTINGNLDVWWEIGEEIEERLIESLPILKRVFVRTLKEINKIRLDYMNDNYVEPETSNILLSSPKHQKYLKTVK